MGEPEGKGGAKPAEKPAAPNLPAGTPKPLQDFVACTVNGIKLKGGKMGWITGKPKISFAPGAAAGTVDITMSAFGLDITLPASVNNGKLVIDAKAVPDLSLVGGPAPKDITGWVDELNAWLRANGNKLGPLVLKDGVLTMTKVAVGGAGKAEEPKKEQPKVKAGPGAGVKTAVGVGTLLLGTLLGTALGDSAPSGSAAIGEEVAVTSGASGTGHVPEMINLLPLPEGGVTGTMTITGPGGSFDASFTLEQAANLLRLEIQENVFIGQVDEQANFLLESERGFFDGSITGNRIVADHRYDGQDFTATGTIDGPVANGADADRPLAGVIRPGVSVDAAAGSNDVGPLGIAGGLMVLGGAAAGAVALRRPGGVVASTCAEEEQEVRRALHAYHDQPSSPDEIPYGTGWFSRAEERKREERVEKAIREWARCMGIDVPPGPDAPWTLLRNNHELQQLQRDAQKLPHQKPEPPSYPTGPM
jgi:hypothetical protein